jgi:hypothetical protein
MFPDKPVSYYNPNGAEPGSSPMPSMADNVMAAGEIISTPETVERTVMTCH